MAKENQHAGMHFVHHKQTVDDSREVAYLQRQEHKKEQENERERRDKWNAEEKPCILYRKDMTKPVYVNYRNSDPMDASMYHYRIKNVKDKDKQKLYLWMGYDIGGKNDATGEEEPRGYYFYFTYLFKNKRYGRKLLLFPVKRYSDAYQKKALDMSRYYAKAIVEHYYSFFEVEWEKPVLIRWDHKSTWYYEELIRQFRTITNCTLND